jgi:inorganic triphosphatase YgiF
LKILSLSASSDPVPFRVDLIVTASSIAPASDALVETLGVAAESAHAKGEQDAVKPAPTDLSREVEVKFVTDAEGFKAALDSPLLQQSGAASPARKLTTIYFDTAESDLQQRRIALRIRRDGRKAPVMTLKWSPAASEGPFSRGEIEIPVPKLLPDLSLFGGEMGELVRRLVGDKPLEARYETRVSRIVRSIPRGAARIEAAFDEGQIVAGERTRPLREVELELKSGEARALYEFAATVAESLPLRLDIVSKAERAYRLATGLPSSPVKAKPAALPPDLIFDEAIARIILGNIDHFVANWASLRESDDPEAIHQMRVALRRLRAALAMFKRVIPCPEFELFRAEARDLATTMGTARDCDALRELVEEGPRAHLGDKKNFAPLMEALEARRLEGYREVRVLLESPLATSFVMRVSAFVERRGWRNSVSQLASLTEPVAVFAGEALERLYKRVLRRGKNLADLPDEERHLARIALKNLRYGGEFFASCFTDTRDASNFIRGTALLQGLLGAHNDAASAEHFLSLPHDNDAARAAGVVTGWFARGSLIADEKLAKSWKKFKQARPFWR